MEKQFKFFSFLNKEKKKGMWKIKRRNATAYLMF